MIYVSWIRSACKSQLLVMDPSGRQYTFKERAIFGRLDDFCRRLTKLSDLFSMIRQFRELKAKQVRQVKPWCSVFLCHPVSTCAQMDGMGRHISSFFHLIKGLRHQRHDLLNFEDNSFDIGYVEFLAKVEEIELQLQVCGVLVCCWSLNS